MADVTDGKRRDRGFYGGGNALETHAALDVKSQTTPVQL